MDMSGERCFTWRTWEGFSMEFLSTAQLMLGFHDVDHMYTSTGLMISDG